MPAVLRQFVASAPVDPNLAGSGKRFDAHRAHVLRTRSNARRSATDDIGRLEVGVRGKAGIEMDIVVAAAGIATPADDRSLSGVWNGVVDVRSAKRNVAATVKADAIR